MRLKYLLLFIVASVLSVAAAKLWIPVRCMSRIDFTHAKCKDVTPEIMSCSGILIEHTCVAAKRSPEDDSVRLTCKAEE